MFRNLSFNNHFAEVIIKLKLFLLIFFLSFSLNSFAQLFQDFRVNDDTGSTYQGNGRLGIDANGNFVVVWEDCRMNNYGDIYCQIFNFNAQRIGKNIKVNSLSSSWGAGCRIAVRKNGSFAVCWRDTLVRLRIFNSAGIPISSEIIVNNVSYTSAGGPAPSISCDSLGNFIVIWKKPIPFIGVNIHFQRFDSIGNKIGYDIKVNEDTASNIHNKPSISVRRDGSFIIAWEKQYSSSVGDYYSIYMQMFDKNGTKIGNNNKIFYRSDSLDQQTTPLISSDDSNRFCIGFTNYDISNGDYDVLCQLYNENGTTNGGPVYIDLSGYDETFTAIYKRNNGDFILGYQKEINLGYFPYCQRMNSNGTPIGIPYRLSNLILGLKGYDDVVIFNDKIISVWTDNRNSDAIDNWDVFCNIRSFQKPDSIISTVINSSNKIPEELKLCQNYPNPFNQITHIKYALKNSISGILYSDAKIVIYNILGKEISILVNEKQSNGIYEVKFDGSNLSTGIYFYSFFVDGIWIDTKKLILLK